MTPVKNKADCDYEELLEKSRRRLLLKAQKRSSDHKAPGRASKHHKVANCAPVNSPVQLSNEESPSDTSPRPVSLFNNDPEAASNDQSARSN